jgi:SNF2 family DNA or RNA helicase
LNDGFTLDAAADSCILDDRFFLSKGIYDKLFPHQRDGVKWMWSIHRDQSGGILGDDMVSYVIPLLGTRSDWFC